MSETFPILSVRGSQRVGDLTLTYEALDLPDDPGQTILASTAEPNSPSHDALNLVASWTSMPNQKSAVHADEEARAAPPWLGSLVLGRFGETLLNIDMEGV